MLESLGVTSEQWSIYRALLMDEDLPDPLAPDILEHLHRLGMVVPCATSSIGWRAVSPTVSIAALVRAREEELAEQRRDHTRVQDEVSRFTDEYLSYRLQRDIQSAETLSDATQVSMRMNELIASAKHEAASLVTNAMNTQMLKGARRGDSALIERGIRVRSIYTESVRREPASMEYLQWFATIGAELRTLPYLPVRMILIDKTVAVVATDAVQPLSGAVVLRVPGVVTALNALFECLWSRSHPIADDSARTPLPHVELEILRGLANGAKDETLAHQLGISVRTVRRLLTKLYDRTGAVSRFQMAVEAMRRGWI